MFPPFPCVSESKGRTNSPDGGNRAGIARHGRLGFRRMLWFALNGGEPDPRRGEGEAVADAGAGNGQRTSDPSYRLGAWSADGTAELAAHGADADALLLAGLRGVLAVARGDRPVDPSDASETSAAPIRGQGGDLAAVFAELAADLLAQLDANGLGLDDVRLDGVLHTDDGGYTAWGYALGAAAAAPPPIGLALDGDPTVTEVAAGFALRATLRRT